MKIEDFIRALTELDMPVFTNSDAVKILGKDPNYVKLYLRNLWKFNKIEKVERGRYCLPKTSPYVIASRITKESYIALISAARFHNITTQLPLQIQVFSIKYHRPIVIKGNYRVKFIKVKREIFYGFKEYNGAYVSEIEKIFVDDVYYNKRMLYTEEYKYALSKGFIDSKKLKQYVEMTPKNGKYAKEYNILKKGIEHA